MDGQWSMRVQLKGLQDWYWIVYFIFLLDVLISFFKWIYSYFNSRLLQVFFSRLLYMFDNFDKFYSLNIQLANCKVIFELTSHKNVQTICIMETRQWVWNFQPYFSSMCAKRWKLLHGVLWYNFDNACITHVACERYNARLHLYFCCF